ncbi:hypothetical protein F5B17DRAFT_419984 [Nemania serpens]|nr:hypothetical protein F5B17DRAFT_419984 [Nemania serpens]
MDLFCVSTRSRRCRGNHSREGTGSDDDDYNEEKNTSLIRTARIEARPRRHLARRKNSGNHAQHPSRAMSPSANSPHADLAVHNVTCGRALCYAAQLHPRPARGSRYHMGYHTEPGDHPTRENLHLQAPVDRLYVHPYSLQHYHFPVVDHSTTRHHPTSHPAYYMAVVPAAATPKDVETALLHRAGLVAMARLSATEELVDFVRVFRSLGALYDASMQLEVWDGEGGVESG